MPETTEVPSLGSDLPPDLAQGAEVKMDMPRPDFSEKPQSPQQAKEQMAEQVRRLLMYVGQEWGEDSLEDVVRGLDDDKVIAFTEQYHDELPFEVLAFLHDVRERVNGLMPELPEDSDVYLDGWTKSYLDAYELKKEDVIAQGRDAVMEILEVAFERNGDLTDTERRGIRVIAQNINDEKIIQDVMDYATGHSYVVMCLLRNPHFDISHINQLVEKVTAHREPVFKKVIELSEQITELQDQDKDTKEVERILKGHKHILEECEGILVEVAGHLARTLDNIIMGRESENNLVLQDGDLDLAEKLVKTLGTVDASKIFLPQIGLAISALKNQQSRELYLERYPEPVSTESSDEKVSASTDTNGNTKRKNKIQRQNANRKKSTTNRKKSKVTVKPSRESRSTTPKKSDRENSGRKSGKVCKAGKESKSSYSARKKRK